MKGVEIQWKTVDRSRNIPSDSYENSFVSFMDGAVQYFKNAFLPLIDGTTIKFKDEARDEYESSLFTPFLFEQNISSLESILNELHFFKTNNPTLMICRTEAIKIMKGEIVSMNHVETLLTQIGDYFYGLAMRLFSYYQQHRLWIFQGSVLMEKGIIRRSAGKLMESDEKGVPFAFYDCLIMEIETKTALSEQLVGKKVLGNSFIEGIFGYMIAYAFQISYECMNRKLFDDLDERKRILRRIDDLKKG